MKGLAAICRDHAYAYLLDRTACLLAEEVVRLREEVREVLDGLLPVDGLRTHGKLELAAESGLGGLLLLQLQRHVRGRHLLAPGPPVSMPSSVLLWGSRCLGRLARPSGSGADGLFLGVLVEELARRAFGRLQVALELIVPVVADACLVDGRELLKLIGGQHAPKVVLGLEMREVKGARGDGCRKVVVPVVVIGNLRRAERVGVGFGFRDAQRPLRRSCKARPVRICGGSKPGHGLCVGSLGAAVRTCGSPQGGL